MDKTTNRTLTCSFNHHPLYNSHLCNPITYRRPSRIRSRSRCRNDCHRHNTSRRKEVRTCWACNRFPIKLDWNQGKLFLIFIISLNSKFFADSSIQANPLSTKKRDRPHIDIALMPLGHTEPSKEASPRILPPPPWLTAANLKVSAHGKTTQIGKRGITDWKSIGGGGKHTSSDLGLGHSNHLYTSNHLSHHHLQPSGTTNDFLLPDCPGASSSPFKASGKKKLQPMGGSVSSELHSLPLNHPNNLVTPVSRTTGNWLKRILLITISVFFTEKFFRDFGSKKWNVGGACTANRNVHLTVVYYSEHIVCISSIYKERFKAIEVLWNVRGLMNLNVMFF